MKKLFALIGAFGLAAGLPQAAHAMDCCKDGKCACCAPKEGGDKDNEHKDHAQ